VITNDQALALADIINPDHKLDFDDGVVATDVVLIVRGRAMDDMRLSFVTTVATPDTDYVTLAGMLHFANLINEGHSE
jgi:hypothetical protein